MPDLVELKVADFQGYDRIRLLCVQRFDCFSEGVLKQLRFLKDTANCERVVGFSYMDALRLISIPRCDLLAETLISIWQILGVKRRLRPIMSLEYPPFYIREIDGEVICFASAIAGASLC